MKTRWIAIITFLAYGALLVKVIVFKSIPVIHLGHFRLKIGGSYHGHANLVPFRTIGPNLLGHPNVLIATLNLGGNIVPFVPVGFLLPFILRRLTWPAAIALAIAVGLAMEGMEVIFHVGIFDVDDVILNALGVTLGYWLFRLLKRR